MFRGQYRIIPVLIKFALHVQTSIFNQNLCIGFMFCCRIVWNLCGFCFHGNHLLTKRETQVDSISSFGSKIII